LGDARVPRVLLIVCDSFGIGGAPDADQYGDEGSNTLGNCARAVGGVEAPNLGRMGLGSLTSIDGVMPEAGRRTGRAALTERSAGKDSMTGHWEMAGVVTNRPFPTYPEGFPEEIIRPFQTAIGREVLGNRPASGTDILEELGAEHLRTGRPILYTSADSVFQIASHEDVVPIETLYEWCGIARRFLTGDHRVGRVIARPFTGSPGSFSRSPRRRDFSVEPPGPTVLDLCEAGGVSVYAVGKIGDVFAGRGISESRYSESNDHGIDLALEFLRRPEPSLVFVNLVDFDSKYGHRNDPRGYARCVEQFDRRIPEIIDGLQGGLVAITGDHGCDPTTPSTDHSRERVPLLLEGPVEGPVDLGVRSTFADLGASIGELLGVVTSTLAGQSFATEVVPA
jgi:phosphopentomutase